MTQQAVETQGTDMPGKVLITERALIQRINRALAKRDQRLVLNRREGCWSVVDVSSAAKAHHKNSVDYDVQGAAGLEKEARELGVLKPWEALEK